jgi:hypothetical protein
VFTSFAEFTDPAHYRAAPGDWLVVVTDIENSTRAISEGRYKDVNMLAASGIVAVLKLPMVWRSPRLRRRQREPAGAAAIGCPAARWSLSRREPARPAPPGGAPGRRLGGARLGLNVALRLGRAATWRCSPAAASVAASSQVRPAARIC